MTTRVLVISGVLTFLSAAVPGRDEGIAADTKQEKRDLVQTMVTTGDSAGNWTLLSGFGPVAIVASSYKLDPAAGLAWQDRGKAKTLKVGTFTAELHRLEADWKVLRGILPGSKDGDQVTVKKVMWSGVSTWMVDSVLSAKAHPDNAALRHRQLIAPLDDGFLVLHFRGSLERFEAERADMRRTALSVRFKVNGLIAEYYASLSLSDLHCLQVDRTIDFDWGTDGPGNDVGSDAFSVQWTGKLKPRHSETYTFTSITDDGVRLWINDGLIIDNWTNHAATEDSADIKLESGKQYNIKMEWYENGGLAVARLFWQSPSQPREILPSACLFSDPKPGFSAPPKVSKRHEAADTGLPALLGEERPGGYVASTPYGLKWDGEDPSQTMVLGQGDKAVHVSLRRLPLGLYEARQVFPAATEKDKGDIRSVIWKDAATWSAKFALDADSHPETTRHYQRLYVALLRKGLVVLSFASADKNWQQTHQDSFFAILDSITFTAEEQEGKLESMQKDVF